MVLLKIILEFLKIGAFSFGGGMATLPYIYEMAEKTSWITENYIGNILTLSQITPGPLACNIGTIVGYNVAGILGAIVANIAFVTPAIVFVGVSFKFVKKIENNKKANEIIKIVRASALAILITSSYSIFKKSFINDFDFFNLNNLIYIINFKSIALGICIFFLIKIKKINTFCIMALAALAGALLKI